MADFCAAVTRHRLSNVLRTNRWFFVPYALLLAGGVLLLTVPKRELFLFVNGRYAPWADGLFSYATYLGDGLFALMVVAVLLLLHYGRALLVAATFLFSGLLSVVLKMAFHLPRPRSYFTDEPDLIRLVKGVTLYGSYSFPSGHTITAFACFATLALVSRRRKWLGLGWLLLACGVAYSRMYLAQHFFEDVYAGALVGTASALLMYLTYERLRDRYGWHWADGSLRARKR